MKTAASCCSRIASGETIFAWTMLFYHEFVPLLVEKEDWSLGFQVVRKGFECFVEEKEDERALTEKEKEKESGRRALNFFSPPFYFGREGIICNSSLHAKGQLNKCQTYKMRYPNFQHQKKKKKLDQHMIQTVVRSIPRACSYC